MFAAVFAKGRIAPRSTRMHAHLRVCVAGGALALLVATLALPACSRSADAKPPGSAADLPPTRPAPAAQLPGSDCATTPNTNDLPSTFEVHRDSLRRYAAAVGSFRARQSTRLGPQISGRVKDVLVNVGDRVTRGQVLVRLDPAFFQIEVNQSRASAEAARQALASAGVDVVDTEREMNRQTGLFEQGAGSTKDRDDAVTRYQRAVARQAEQSAKLTEAQRQLEYSEQRLAETEIRAPYDGAVTSRMVDPGEPAAATPPTHVLEVQEVGVLYLEYCLPQELLDSVSVGAPVEFEVEGVRGGAGSTTVAVIFPAIEESTRSFRCRSIVDNSTGQYQPGLLARVRVVAQEVQNALVVPRTALTQTAGGWQVLVAVNGRPVPRPVEMGLLSDDRVQVLRGLQDGERIFVTATGNARS